jgi:hypothetical protein
VVHRVGAVGLADLRRLLGRRRGLLHERQHLHALGRALDAARPPRRQAEEVLADHAFVERQGLGDLGHLGQDLRLEDVALARGDADHNRVFVPEELLDGVGGDDEGVALREGLVGIDDHLQRADLGQQEERDQRKSRDDQQALAHDPGDERLQESPQGSNIDSSIVIMTISIVKSSDILCRRPWSGHPVCSRVFPVDLWSAPRVGSGSLTSV